MPRLSISISGFRKDFIDMKDLTVLLNLTSISFLANWSLFFWFRVFAKLLIKNLQNMALCLKMFLFHHQISYVATCFVNRFLINIVGKTVSMIICLSLESKSCDFLCQQLSHLLMYITHMFQSGMSNCYHTHVPGRYAKLLPHTCSRQVCQTVTTHMFQAGMSNCYHTHVPGRYVKLFFNTTYEP